MPPRRRASGQTAAEEAAEKAGEHADEGASVDLDVERSKAFESMGFSRLRLDWRSEDRAIIQRAQIAVQGMVDRAFPDALQLMSDLYDLVREKAVDPATGEVLTNEFGDQLWARTPSGAYYEDWTRLTMRAREDFLFRITTALFAWEQLAAEVWLDAMMAKAIWQERFAIGYEAPMSGTIEDREAAANRSAADERYFAILRTAYSRKAEALVRSMERLQLRLKDTLA